MYLAEEQKINFYGLFKIIKFTRNGNIYLKKNSRNVFMSEIRVCCLLGFPDFERVSITESVIIAMLYETFLLYEENYPQFLQCTLLPQTTAFTALNIL